MLRSILFWLHLAAGVGAGVVILMMSFTGTVLMYEAQVMEWRERSYFGDPVPAGARLEAARLVEIGTVAGRRLHGESFTPEVVRVRSDPRAPVELRDGRDRIYLHAGTGAVQGTGFPRTQAFLSAVRGWHRWFNLSGEARTGGRAVTGAANLAFLFILVTGAVLWIPRRLSWRHLRAVLLPRPGARGRARDFNWHNVVGIWTLVPMLLIVTSGAVISYRWAGDLVYRAVGEEPPARGSAGPASGDGAGPGPEATSAVPDVDAALHAAARRMPEWRTLQVTLPEPGDASTTVRVYGGHRGQPQHTATLVADAMGEETEWTTLDDQSAGRRVRSFLRFAHTGEYWGLPGQTLAGLVSLAGVVLVWTGVSLALRRLAAALRRRRRTVRWEEERTAMARSLPSGRRVAAEE